jgi:simple sugar transport system permease protein
MNELALFLQLSVQLGTPFLFGTLGGILCEKVGNMNLGIEGMMMMGAFFGFVSGFATTSPVVAVLAAMVGGALGALIYAVITVTLKGNQTVTGFALTIFGTGLANFLGKPYSSQIQNSNITTALGTHAIPGLDKIPVLGTALFSQSLFVYFSIILAIGLLFYYKKSRFGLAARMVGESPATADASGINVDLYKYVHILLGGAVCGLGGAYLSLVYVPYWQDNITAGIGWIAVALVIFSGWNPVKAVFGCYLFGILKALAVKFQGVTISLAGLDIPVATQVMDMIPYILTVVVLVFSAATSKSASVGPASIGKSYFREDR